MTTRGTSKFKYTDGLTNVTPQTGFLGADRSGFAKALVVAMIVGIVYFAFVAH